MQLRIEKLSTDGKGIARTENGIIFVIGALPGETAEVEIVKRKREYSIAKVKSILEPSKYRINPICPHFSNNTSRYECGGCQIQHSTYPFQLEVKASFIEESLLRIGKIKLEDKIICGSSPKVWNYRNKASFPVKNINNRVSLGFYAMSSHDLVLIDSCAIIHDKLNTIFSVIKESIQDLGFSAYNEKFHSGTLRHVILRTNGDQVLVSYVVNGKMSRKQRDNIVSFAGSMPGTTFTINENSTRGNVILGRLTETISGCGYIETKTRHHILRYDTTSFFQVNTEQSENLYEYACSFVPENSSILELYCGIGSLTMKLAGKARQVTAVEEWEEAVHAMKVNLNINRITNVIPVCSDAEVYISSDEKMFDAVLLDPPRSGCSEKVISSIISKSIPRIIYVSCNAATLARDLKKFIEFGYIIDSIKAFDMFPQTSHVECCCVLTK
jgi:23S rRNA (uracil1939-C5)-methyltransferase